LLDDGLSIGIIFWVLFLVSKAPAEAPKQQKYESFEVYKATYKTDDQKKEEVRNYFTNVSHSGAYNRKYSPTNRCRQLSCKKAL